MTTIAALKRADSRTPHTRTMVTTATMNTASPLKTMGTPSACGAVAMSPAVFAAER